MMPRIRLVVGEGARFGTGHQVRMRELQAALRARTIESEWHSVFDFAEATAREAARTSSVAPLTLIDARDLNPLPFVREGAFVLALDNRHVARAESEGAGVVATIEFYDTIPHPDADLRATLGQALISADVRALAKSGEAQDGPRSAAPEQARSLFVYSGSFAVPELDRALLRLVDAGWSVHRCGSAEPVREFALRAEEAADARASIRWNARLERADFLHALGRANRVWTYFGMTLLEAWFLERELSLLPIESAIHAQLANYLQDAAGLAAVEPSAVLEHAHDAFQFSAGVRRGLRPDGRGFELLVDRICARVDV